MLVGRCARGVVWDGEESVCLAAAVGLKQPYLRLVCRWI